jgi:pyrroline-5-carboxylate reductase
LSSSPQPGFFNTHDFASGAVDLRFGGGSNLDSPVRADGSVGCGMDKSLETPLNPALLIVGGGKMGEALLGGMLGAQRIVARDVFVVEPSSARRDELGLAFPAVASVASVLDLPHALAFDGALIAVKPQHVKEVCEAIAPRVNRVLSIAAGVRIAAIEDALGGVHPVIRSMPNTPAFVGMGASAIAAGTHARSADIAWAMSILGAVGVVEQVDERLLDAVTGLSGSGPAYVFLMAEALIEGGVAAGLPRNIAVSLANQTIAGAGKLLLESSDDAATLRGNVTSPGGTTAAGLRALEAHGVRSAFIEAVAAATERSRELG